ncbi:MAG: hypothetical protein M5U34_13090 [Chloroflexi bacterium]|nr:hypothetical protein [Chloroflexota bacterium]
MIRNRSSGHHYCAPHRRSPHRQPLHPLLLGSGDSPQAIDANFTEFIQDITNRAQGTATAQSGDMLEGEAAATEPAFVPGQVITSTSCK